MGSLLPFLIGTASILLEAALQIGGYQNTGLGLLLGAVAVVFWGWAAIAWFLQRANTSSAAPDFSGKDAFRYLILDSKWASGKGPGQDNYELAFDTEPVVRDACATGQIKVWGRVLQRHPAAGTNPLRAIDLDFWKDGRFDSVSIVYSSYPTITANRPFGIPTELLEDIQFNEAEFKKKWKPSLFWFLDRNRRNRKRVFKHSPGLEDPHRT